MPPSAAQLASSHCKVGPATAGLSLRALIHRTCLDAIVEGRTLRAIGCRRRGNSRPTGVFRATRSTMRWPRCRPRDCWSAASVPERSLHRAPLVRASRLATHGPQALSAARPSLQLSRWSRDAAVIRAPPARRQSRRPSSPGYRTSELFPHELWRRLTARRLRTSARALAGYLPSLGLPALQEATARHLAAARELVCEPGQILVLNSTMQAADLIARVLLDRGQPSVDRGSVVSEPAILARTLGARLVPVPVDGGGHGCRCRNRARAASRAGLRDAVLPLSARRFRCRWNAGARCSTGLPGPARGSSRTTIRASSSTRDARMHRSQAWSEMAAFFTSARSRNAVFPSLRLAYVVLPSQLVDVFAAVRGQLDDHTHGLAQAVFAGVSRRGPFRRAPASDARPCTKGRREVLIDACRAEPPRWHDARAGGCGDERNAAVELGEGPIVRWRKRRRNAVSARFRCPGTRCERPAWRGLLLGYAALDETDDPRRRVPPA